MVSPALATVTVAAVDRLHGAGASQLLGVELLARDDVVGEDLGQVALGVGQQAVEGGLVDLGEGVVGRGEDRERAGAVERVDQVGGLRPRRPASTAPGCSTRRWPPGPGPCRRSCRRRRPGRRRSRGRRARPSRWPPAPSFIAAVVGAIVVGRRRGGGVAVVAAARRGEQGEAGGEADDHGAGSCHGHVVSPC